MSENLIIGCLTMTGGVALQAVVVSLLFSILLNLEKRLLINAMLFRMSSLLITIMLAMLAGNLIQMTLWAGVFFVCGRDLRFRHTNELVKACKTRIMKIQEGAQYGY